MQKIIHVTFSLLAFTLLLSTLGNTRALVAESMVKGARTEDLIIKFYSSIEAAYQALKDGSIDILGYEITADLYYDAINDTNIILSPVGDMGMYEFDINNNYTCIEYPGIRSPTNYLGFRQALAFLSPKDHIVEEFCGGFANRIDQPLAYMQKGWRNTSYWYEGGTYPYEYDPAAAAATLDTAGFLQGTTNNTYYDPAFPGSVEKIRTYPTDHSKAGQDLDALIVYVRDDDLRRMKAGDLLIQNMRKQGMPVSRLYCHYPWCNPMYTHEYHVYTGGWSVRSFVPQTLYGLFHSENYFLGGSNYVTGNDSAGNPNYPKLDQLLELGRFPSNLSEATSAAKRTLGYFTEQCITIPLFSARSYWAWSSRLLGLVNSLELGADNDYSFMNMYAEDELPIRFALITPPNELNVIHSSWYYDYQCLNRMYDGLGLTTAPYDLSIDQGGFIKSWESTEWIDWDTMESKTLVRQCCREDAYFVEPVTGTQLENVNNTHMCASIWYFAQTEDAWIHDEVADVKTIRMIDCPSGPYGIEVYFDTADYLNTYYGGRMSYELSVLSFNWFSKGNLSREVTESLVVQPDGYLYTSEPVFWVKEARNDGTVLEHWADYRIQKVNGTHANLCDMYAPDYVGQTVNVTYLAVGDPSGYTPGDLPWQDAFEGCGMYYAVDFTPGVGGNLTLKRNPFYWMETPLIGEVNFVRKPDGCLKVDIFDVVMAATAYGSQGVSIPDQNWLPGADLAPSAGIVDIFDIVTITSKYGEEFDCDP